MGFSIVGSADPSARASGSMSTPAAGGGAGGGDLEIVTTSVDYTAAVGQMVLVTSTGGNVTVTLPAAAGNINERVAVIKVSLDANIVRVVTPGAETIEGADRVLFRHEDQGGEFKSDGTNWLAVPR